VLTQFILVLSYGENILQPFFAANFVVGVARLGGGPLAMSPFRKATIFSVFIHHFAKKI
jgi:hypothetical protein